MKILTAFLLLPITIAWFAVRAAGHFLWSIFGNDEDPSPPDDWQTTWPRWYRFFNWYVLRNPLHNLFFHRIGIVGQGWAMSGRFPGDEHQSVAMWPPEHERFAWCVHTHPRHSWLMLPFVSWRIPIKNRGIEGYIGWRPSGALGGSLRVLESTAA